MKVLLIETEAEGHYISLYLKNIIKEILLRKEISLSLMTTRTIMLNNDFKFLRNNKINKFYISNIKKPKRYNLISLFLYQIKYYFNIKTNFKKISKTENFDLVYMNTLDHFDKALSVFGSPFQKVKFYGLINNLKFHLNYYDLGKNFYLSFFYEKLFKRILNIKNLKNLFVIDNYIKVYLTNKKIDNCKLVKINEAINYENIIISKREKFIFKKKNSLNNNDFIILIYGAIREDKGIKYLINCITQNSFDKKIKIIIAGKCEKKILQDIKEFEKKSKQFNFEIILFDFFINENFQKILFSVSDLIWIGYEKYYGSSGVYYLSGLMKRPVIVNNSGAIHYLNKKYKIGVNTDVTDQKKVSKKIKLIMFNGPMYYKNNFKKFINLNKKNVFAKKIIKTILF